MKSKSSNTSPKSNLPPITPSLVHKSGRYSEEPLFLCPSLKNPDSNLWSVAQQLFEAVDFMHEHGVAHLDLKPQNIIIPPLGGWLSIIDFNTSVRINGPDDTFCGAVGTDGYMPPEVEAGMGRYSALRADLWSCGKTLEELCLLCRPSEERQLLLEIADRLLSETPSARPTMANVLELMSSRKG